MIDDDKRGASWPTTACLAVSLWRCEKRKGMPPQVSFDPSRHDDAYRVLNFAFAICKFTWKSDSFDLTLARNHFQRSSPDVLAIRSRGHSKKGKEAAKKSSSHMAYCLQDLSHCGRKSQTAAHFSCFVFFFYLCKGSDRCARASASHPRCCCRCRVAVKVGVRCDLASKGKDTIFCTLLFEIDTGLMSTSVVFFFVMKGSNNCFLLESTLRKGLMSSGRGGKSDNF